MNIHTKIDKQTLAISFFFNTFPVPAKLKVGLLGSRPCLQTINFIKKVISKSDVFHPGQGGGLAEPFSPVNKPLPPVNKSRGSGGVAAARFLLGPQLINIPGGGGGTYFINWRWGLLV